MNNSSPSRILVGDLVVPATVILHLKSGNRDAVLVELISAITEIRDQASARQTLLAALQEREQLHTTAIGEGIALPHARNALVGLVDRPILVFGRHPTGIPYGADDGQPARLFFLLVAPTVTTHLQMLSRISRILRDPRVRTGLLTADNPTAILTVIRDAESRL